MAATNVQAFSGDVEISSNLVVNTDDLFVDTVSGNVGIGTVGSRGGLEVVKASTSTTPSTSTHGLTITNDQTFPVFGGQYYHTGLTFRGYGVNYSISDLGKIVVQKINSANLGDSDMIFYTNYETDRGNGGPGDLYERMRITTTGDVGIGTDGPGHKLDVNGSIHADHMYLEGFVYHDGDTDCKFGFATTDNFTVSTSGYERMRINPSGFVGIGTDNPKDNLHIFETGGVGTSSNPLPKLLFQHYTAAGSPAWGDYTADIVFNYHSWDGYRGGGITAFRGSYNNVRNTSLVFYNNNGAARFYVFNDGQCTATSNMSWSNQQGWDVNVTLQAPNAVYYQARCYGWPAYSSRKLKENFEPILDSLDKVKQLNGVYYTWKQGQGDNVLPSDLDQYDTTHMVKQQKHLGFIADEVAEVLPWVCTFDENGEANGLDYGAITPVLANAIKELDIKIGKSEASSDDRLKDNETYIRNATKTLMKLKPQIYDKKESLTSNVYQHEAGLIAQDIWYDAPELRFAVKPGLLSEIPVDAPVRSDDPREDPDYSKWGPNPASVDYNYLIPYTIKSIQEIVTDLPRQKTQVIGVTPSNLNNTRGLVVVSDMNDFQKGVPKLSLSTNSYDKKCFGVISQSNTYSIDNEILIDTNGTGRVWVINTSNIESGDYLTTSNITGYAMKQNDDLLHNYTLAKSTIDCNFNPVQKTIKRVKQELRDVTYYIKTKLFEITKEQYDSMDEMYRTSREYSYYKKSDYARVSERGGYDKMQYFKLRDDKITNEVTGSNTVKQACDIISIDEWNTLESNVQNTYSPYYSNLVTTEVSLEDYTTLDEVEKAKCTFTTRTVYSYKVREESKDPLPEYEPEVRQEYVNVLDENGQLQWEDTQQTEASYEIRYLDANGNITDESNVVHIAALIGCKFC